MHQLIKIKKSLIFISTLAVFTAPHHAIAADAGQIQRDIERLNTPILPPKVSPEISPSAAPHVQSDISVKVSAFKLIGAQTISDQTLQANIQRYIGQTLSFVELNRVTQVLSELYRKNGRLAKVFLPPQDIQNGVVTIEIIEAKLGKIDTIAPKAVRLNTARASHMLAQAQQAGLAMNMDALERAMLLINDMPGYSAQATLASGTQAAETDITLSLTDKLLLTGNVWLDNYGTKPLGDWRLNGLVNFNNLTGHGDRLSLQALKSRGLEYVASDISFPIGYAGTAFMLGGSVANYNIVEGAGKDLNAEGDSSSYHFSLKHPFIRSRNANLYGQASFESFFAQNHVLGLEVSDQVYRAVTLDFSGDQSDSFGLGGLFWGGLGITVGNLDLSGNRLDLASDKISARRDGHYGKLNVYVGRQQILSDKWTGNAVLSAQLANQNLGGFEKFSLGGPSGLQGFAVGEASADEGWMLNLEGRYAINQHWSTSVLADAGGVCQNKDTWAGWNAGNPKQDNCYQLASVGAGVSFINQYVDIKLNYGRKISSNPGLDANGRDIEGQSAQHQLWFLLSTRF